MNAEQRAIIEAAEKEGVPACERDARLVVYSMVKATLAAMGKYEVGLNKMTEKQQDAVIGDLESSYKDTALSIARAMASAGTPSVVMDCKDLKIANGTFTGIVKADQKFFNELISKVQDKSEVVVVLYERQYADALDAIESDKDQRSLPLEGASKPDKKPRASAGTGSATSAGELAKKAIELPPKLIEDAREFIIKNQVAKVSSLQNFLKINMTKAEALQKLFEKEGLIEFVGTDASGEYEIVRAKPEASNLKNPSSSEEAAAVGGNTAPTELTDEIYEQIKAKVLETGKVSIGALSITFSLDDEIVEQAIDRLELEGVVTEENEMGVRSIVGAE